MLDAAFEAPAAEPVDVGALYRCLSTLAARDRKVVYLSFNEGLSAEQVSVALETTPGNVRVLRHRAIARLRRCMDGSLETEAE